MKVSEYNNLLLIATDVTMEVGYDNRKFTLIFEVNIGDDLVNFNCLEENVNYKFFEGHYVVDVGGPLVYLKDFGELKVNDFSCKDQFWKGIVAQWLKCSG